MRGLVLINGYPNGEKFYKQGNRIAEELRLFGIETDVRRNGEIYAKISADGSVQTNAAKQYAFVVYLDKDKYLGKMLEAAGLRLFNSAAAVEVCDDKMLTYLALRQAGVPMIESIPAPLCYTPNAKADEAFLQSVADTLGFPLVIKQSYGSFGAGVHLVPGMPELQKKANELLHVPHFYQRFIAGAAGRDIRVIVIGGKAVAAMERVAKAGEFRSNIELGGVGRQITLSKQEMHAAECAAQALGLDYCGVDLLQTPQGVAVCEVNSNAFFDGLERTTGVNVARLYAEYIYKYILSRKGIDKNPKV